MVSVPWIVDVWCCLFARQIVSPLEFDECPFDLLWFFLENVNYQEFNENSHTKKTKKKLLLFFNNNTFIVVHYTTSLVCVVRILNSLKSNWLKMNKMTDVLIYKNRIHSCCMTYLRLCLHWTITVFYCNEHDDCGAHDFCVGFREVSTKLIFDFSHLAHGIFPFWMSSHQSAVRQGILEIEDLSDIHGIIHPPLNAGNFSMFLDWMDHSLAIRK